MRDNTVKKVIYGTILLFVAILIATIIVASRHDVVLVEYRDGKIVEQRR